MTSSHRRQRGREVESSATVTSSSGPMAISVCRAGDRPFNELSPSAEGGSPLAAGNATSPATAATAGGSALNIKMKKCPICHKRMQLRSLRRHARRVHSVRMILNNDEILEKDEDDINAIVSGCEMRERRGGVEMRLSK